MEPLFDTSVPKIVFWSVVGTLIGAAILAMAKNTILKYHNLRKDLEKSFDEQVFAIEAASQDGILFDYIRSQHILEIESYRHNEISNKVNSIYIMILSIAVYQIEKLPYIIPTEVLVAALFSGFGMVLSGLQDRQARTIQQAMGKMIEKRIDEIREKD